MPHIGGKYSFTPIALQFKIINTDINQLIRHDLLL